jgi:hypothetical protein
VPLPPFFNFYIYFNKIIFILLIQLNTK